MYCSDLKKCHTTENIARHEIPDWCQHPQRGPPAAAASGINLIYPHCPPNGEATTLDVACYPPPGGPVNGGPDILPTKRQTVVDRLRRRLEAYRRHQGSCQPRYDQSANGQYDIQRQETLQLKQRFLESKAKKTRRNDHGRNSGASANGNDPSQKNSNTVSSPVIIFYLGLISRTRLKTKHACNAKCL
ncbi:mamL-1 domain-containing protein [Caerostris darwini]|uniref:MamL-1 domain-containing protein n=1 Tax=Caerostris darwini TaxID=1538125 RepID=A0AAV4T7X1_9ARAC|nr:mamL-1 domain-containing protein [Caerostris darwini]